LDAGTSQLAAVQWSGHVAWLSPVRSLSGTPNKACTAPIDIAGLPSVGMWSGGYFDDLIIAHPSAGFDFGAFVERLRLGTWATGSNEAAAGRLRVSDAAVTAVASHTLSTGAQQVSYSGGREPSRAATVYRSSNNGTSWVEGPLPASFTGLVRFDISLNAGDAFTGVELLPPSPTLAVIPTQTVPQRGSETVDLNATYTGPVSWNVAVVGLNADVQDDTLTLSAEWAAGDIPVTATVRDQWGRTASRTFTAQVEAPDWEPPQPSRYPRVPIILGTGNDQVAIIDSLSAVATSEVNGEQYFEFTVPVKHRRAGVLAPELQVSVAGDLYKVRRIETARESRVPVYSVYCEALFYDLAYAGQIDGREFLQTTAGDVLALALEGTGWTIAAVNVTTRRTYTVEDCSPLELLRTVQAQHGGDLLFDNVGKTVSLVTRSGRDVGVAFFYGRGLTESQRVVDTTSLVTRIYARNEEGVTIASVNSGVPYVEDFTWTSEVREATYDFASGTSPFTMLSMSQATLANRCKPSYSYKFTVADLSHQSGQEIDRFDVGDTVTVVDDELGIRESQRIVSVEHDIVQPWKTKVTLSGKLRELGKDSSDQAGALTTGANNRAFDLVPFNLLKNGRFDNALAHWASSGVEIVDGAGTGDYAVRFEGEGTRWIEQTVNPDNRSEYALSMHTRTTGGDVPPLRALVTVEYEDGTTETIPVELT
jgi:phage minor structural protein